MSTYISLLPFSFSYFSSSMQSFAQEIIWDKKMNEGRFCYLNRLTTCHEIYFQKGKSVKITLRLSKSQERKEEKGIKPISFPFLVKGQWKIPFSFIPNWESFFWPGWKPNQTLSFRGANFLMWLFWFCLSGMAAAVADWIVSILTFWKEGKK